MKKFLVLDVLKYLAKNIKYRFYINTMLKLYNRIVCKNIDKLNIYKIDFII